MRRVETGRGWLRGGFRGPPRWALGALLMGWLLTSHVSTAQGERGVVPGLGVPPELQPWIPWVLDGANDAECPVDGSGRRCLWPSRLALTLGARGGRFRLWLASDHRGSAVLPGSAGRWPQNVRVDGKRVVVLERERVPILSVGPGTHRVTGDWAWARVPEYLDVPPSTALLEVWRDGVREPTVHRVQPGRLRLGGRSEREEEVEESLELIVFRHIQDGVPLRVRTRIEMRVSGPPREVILPSPLLPGSEPESIDSKLNARWSEGGELIVGLLPGAHALEMVARRLEPNRPLAAREAVAPWPSQEIWVFQAAPQVREVTVSGAPGIDPSRTDLPQDWQRLPAYRVRGGEALRFDELRRGQPEPGQNLLSLRRRLWLDLDGEGFTAEDTLSGELRRDFRLDLRAATLRRATLAGVPQLVTRHPETGDTGVELRQAELQLQGVFHLPANEPLPAVGWSEGVQSLSAELALPPGFKLLAATGVDRAEGSWLSQWRLWDFFFVLVLAVSLLRLAHWRLAGALLLTLVLTHGRPFAPHWVWGLVLVALLLGKLPADRLRWTGPWLRAGAVLCFALVTLRFCLVEARAALFPQLDESAQADTGGGFSISADAAQEPMQLESGPAPRMLGAQKGKQMAAAVELMEAQGGGGKRRGSSYFNPALAPAPSQHPAPSGAGLESPPQDAVVQTGPALPTWSFTRSALRWSGPVQRDQTFRLYLAPPWLTRCWAALRALGCVLVGAWLVRRLYGSAGSEPPPSPGSEPPPSPGSSGPPTPSPNTPPAKDTERGGAGAPLRGTRRRRAVIRGLSLALLLGVGGFGPAEAAAAPSAELLGELKARLLRPPTCAPQCAVAPRAALRVEGDELELELELEAGVTTSAELLGPAAVWAPERVQLDGKSASLALGTDGHLRVRLNAGFHRLRASGQLLGDEAVLTFPQAPGLLTLALNGWEASGLGPEGQVVGALRLARTTRPLPPAGAEPGESVARALPRQWLLQRSVELGEEWVVHNRLERTAAQSGPRAPAAVVAVPLLEGETVSDPQVTAAGGVATLRLGRGESFKAWTSRLAPREELSLQAPAASARVLERWRLRCGIVWHCELSDLTPVRRFGSASNEAQGWLPEFWPWPGETLRLRVRRPKAAPGTSVTIERAVLSVDAGARTARSTLEFHVNTTSAAREVITLPEGAAVERLRIDGRERPVRPDSSEAVVLLAPGVHQVSLTFQEARGWSPRFAAPQVSLSHPAENVRVEVSVPQDRWLLWAHGPRWGPAIVFWPLVALTLLFAGLLSRLPQTPLSFRQWSLLGLGLVSRPAPLGVAIVVWLLAVKLRAGRPIASRWGYNLLKVALALGTVVATGLIVAAVYSGLVVRPDMQVSGAGSHGFHLSWYLDHTREAAALPAPKVWSLPLWVYRGLMLLWALWLAQAWVRWLTEAFRVLSVAPLWQRKRRAVAPVIAEPETGASGSTSGSGTPME